MSLKIGSIVQVDTGRSFNGHNAPQPGIVNRIWGALDGQEQEVNLTLFPDSSPSEDLSSVAYFDTPDEARAAQAKFAEENPEKGLLIVCWEA